MTPTENEYIEVLDTRKAFIQALKARKWKIISAVLFTILWIFGVFKFTSNVPIEGDSEIIISALPVIGIIFWLNIVYSEIRQAFWKQLALKYKWIYTSTKDISGEKSLLFNIGHSKNVSNGIMGDYNNLPLQIFEYEYTVGSGKNKRIYSFTVFEVKFRGTFPHLYLNYTNDWYSNSPSMFSSFSIISLPQEFANKFKLYVPKEYEIEALQIFTPDVFSLLLDSNWDHDMEFIDGELIIYSNKKFANFTDLDNELNKIKEFIDILSPLLNKFKLHQIGDYPSSLK